MTLQHWQKTVIAVLMLTGPFLSLARAQTYNVGHRYGNMTIIGPSSQPLDRWLAELERMILDRQRASLSAPTANPSSYPLGRAVSQRPANVTVSSQELRTLDLMNVERRKAGLAPLSLNPNLEQAGATTRPRWPALTPAPNSPTP